MLCVAPVTHTDRQTEREREREREEITYEHKTTMEESKCCLRTP